MFLLNLVEGLSNITKVCKVMSFSQDTFYRHQELAQEGDVDALISQLKKPCFIVLWSILRKGSTEPAMNSAKWGEALKVLKGGCKR